MSSPDITVTIVFHEEGAYVIPALESLQDLVGCARATGTTVETNAILDRPNELTKHLVSARGGWLNAVREVSHGDLGLTRNDAANFASGEYLAFLDGDDLWGEEWLWLAYTAATSPSAPNYAIWHPDRLFYFFEGDFSQHSISRLAKAAARSFHMAHISSELAAFDRRTLFLNNVWTSNAFAKREVHLRYPYQAVDSQAGFGVEDWSWNIHTLWSGVPHLVVPNTVHIIRQKEIGSLGQKNSVESLLPYLPADFDAA